MSSGPHAHAPRHSSVRAGAEARQLSALLAGVGRGEDVQRLYCAARLPPLMAVWEGYAAGTPFAAWLPSFYEATAAALAGECSWCAAALPERCPELPLALLGALLARVEKPFKQRLGVAMAASTGAPWGAAGAGGGGVHAST